MISLIEFAPHIETVLVVEYLDEAVSIVDVKEEVAKDLKAEQAKETS